MANISNPAFEQPTNPNIWLWRYMDLSKFASLLQRQALAFARADKLGDPFEGSIPKVNAMMSGIENVQHRLQLKNNPYPELSVEELRHKRHQEAEARRRARMLHYISCWHMNESESAAMWKLYSHSSDAVCIRTTYKCLSGELSDEFHIGLIKYIDFRTHPRLEKTSFDLLMKKRQSFSHEREARVIMVETDTRDVDNLPTIKEIQIDINKMIKEVFVSPEAEVWFRDVVQNLAYKYGLRLIVKQSDLNQTPMY